MSSEESDGITVTRATLGSNGHLNDLLEPVTVSSTTVEDQPNVDLADVWQPLERVLVLHPKYHAVFSEAVDQLFYGNGPLPLVERHYLALMAASRHQCRYLMDLHRREFDRLGGDLDWLDGLALASTKVAKLDVVNRVLAHQPWSITADHLQKLTRWPDNWSLSELVQGVTIIATTHALCSFVIGCGNIRPAETTQEERDAASCLQTLRSAGGQPSPTGKRTISPRQSGNGEDEGEVERLMKSMAELRTISSAASNAATDEDMTKRFLAINQDSLGVLSPTTTTSNGASVSTSPQQHQHANGERQPAGGGEATTGIDPLDDSCSSYTNDIAFGYVDFVQKANAGEAHTLKIHEFSWDDQGFSCVDELYQEMSSTLDKKFTLTQDLTYRTMGNHDNVDTSKYRTAIWMYIQSLYGIRHDDYNYAEVNVMLNRQMKTFVKTCCCFPEKATDALRCSVMTDFKTSEKVHVVLMILEARLQSELLYFLRAVTRLHHHRHGTSDLSD